MNTDFENNKTNRVAIILAVYNGGLFLEEQLLSIAGQKHKNIHIFIRDDGSTDDSLHIIKNVLDNNIYTILDNKNVMTKSAAGNFFTALMQIDLSKFDYISFADQDDVWLPNKVSTGISCMQASSSAGYSSNLVAFDNAKNTAWFMRKQGPDKNFDYLFQGASAGCTYMLNTNAAELVKLKITEQKFFDVENKSHDWLIYAICRSHGLKWFHDANATILYRQHNNNVYSALASFHGLKIKINLVQSGWYRNHILWLFNFLLGTKDEKKIFIKLSRLNFVDKFWLVTNCFSYRRSFKQAILLAIMILFIF